MALAEVGSYYISLVPTAHNITGHIKKTLAPAQGVADESGREAGGRFSRAFGGAVSGVGHALASALKVGTVAAGAAVAAAGAVGLKTAAELETAQISFTTMLGSAQKAKTFLGELKDFAAKTPFDLPGLNTAAKSLISIGISTDKVIPIMTTLGNVTSGMGTGAEGIKRATVALQQMNAAQKISAEDLNQLRDAGIPVYELLTAATGKTTAEIAEMRDKGKLGKAELDLLMSALETGVGFERFNGLMEQQSASITGLWSTLKDTFGVGMAGIIEPLVPLIKQSLGGSISFLSDVVVPRGTAAMAGFVGALTQSGGAIDKARDSYYLFKSALQGGYSDGEGWVSPETAARIQAVGAAVRNVVLWLGQLDFSSVQEFFASLHLEGLAPAFDSIGASLVKLVPAAGQFATSFAAMTPDVLATGVNLLAGAMGFLAEHTDWIIANMPLIVGGFILWKVAQMGVNVVTAASVPLMVAANVARTVAAVAEYRLVTAQYAAIGSGTALNATQQLGIIATIRATSLTIAHNVAMLASATGARIAAAGMWLWNAAISANPIALVIKGIALLVAGMVWFFTQTELGRGIITAVWAGIQGAIGGVVSWFTDVALPLVTGFFSGIGGAATGTQADTSSAFGGIQNFIGGVIAWFRDTAFPIAASVFAGVAAAASTGFSIVSTVIGVAWGIISGIFNAWVFVFSEIIFPIIRTLWEDVVQPVFFLAGEAIKFFWNLARGIFEVIVSVLTNFVFPVFMALLHAVIDPVFRAAGAVIGWVWNTLILPIFGAVVGWIVDKLSPPFFVFQSVVSTVWDGVSTAISGAWNWIRDNVFGPMQGFLEKDLPGIWEAATKAIGIAWDAIQNIAKAPIKWVIENVINKGIVDTFNNVAGSLPGVKKLDKVKLPEGWRTGGYTGDIHPNEVAGFVHGREYVLREKATSALMRQYGMSGLNHMNRTGELPTAPGAASAPHGAQMAGPGTRVFGQSSFSNQLQRDIFASRRVYVNSLGGIPSSYNIAGAARQWNGLANVEMINGIGFPQVNVSSKPVGAGIAGWYQGNEVALSNRTMGGNPDYVVSVHELGHALGLPHAHRVSANGQGGGDGTHSVMNYDTQWATKGIPTGGDVRALRDIYPGAVKGLRKNGSEGDDGGGGGGFNPFQFIMDGLGDGLKKVFPGGGAFVDLAVGTVKKTFDDVSSWVLDKIGGFWDWLTGGGGDKEPPSGGNVSEWAKDGLMRTGDYNDATQKSLVRRIMQESSGDPKAVNMWDSNAGLGGTHGLMQILKSNWETFRNRDLKNDIYDPLANIVAGINYTRNRYGGDLRKGWDRPGGYKSGGFVDPSMRPLLFDDGGLLHNTGGPQIIDHRRRAPDKVLTDAQWDAMYGIAENTGNVPDVYVQSPFDGEYILARTTPHAVATTGDVLGDTLIKARRGGKYKTGRRR